MGVGVHSLVYAYGMMHGFFFYDVSDLCYGWMMGGWMNAMHSHAPETGTDPEYYYLVSYHIITT